MISIRHSFYRSIACRAMGVSRCSGMAAAIATSGAASAGSNAIGSTHSGKIDPAKLAKLNSNVYLTWFEYWFDPIFNFSGPKVMKWWKENVLPINPGKSAPKPMADGNAAATATAATAPSTSAATASTHTYASASTSSTPTGPAPNTVPFDANVATAPTAISTNTTTAAASSSSSSSSSAAATAADSKLEPSVAADASGAAAAAAAAAAPSSTGEVAGVHKLFVGQVPGGTSEFDLLNVFSPYGKIHELVILKDTHTGMAKGCGFVSYVYRSNAEAAIQALDSKHTLPGAKRALAVRFAAPKPEAPTFASTAGAGTAIRGPPSTAAAAALPFQPPAAGGSSSDADVKLYVGMLSRSSTEDEIRALFEPYGVVKEVHLIRETDGKQRPKGSAFVKYGRRDEAERAVTALHGRWRDKEAPGMIIVRFAHTKAEKQMIESLGAGALTHAQQSAAAGAFGLPPPSATLAANWTHPSIKPLAAALPSAVTAGVPSGWTGQQYLQAMTALAQAAAASSAAATTAAGGSAPAASGAYQAMMNMMSAAAATAAASTATAPPLPAASIVSQSGGGGGARGPAGANLFVYNLPLSFSDADLLGLFSPFGTILSSHIQRDRTTGSSKGFGFVSFDAVQGAQSSISGLDGFVIGNRKLSVRVKKEDGGSFTPGNRPY